MSCTSRKLFPFGRIIEVELVGAIDPDVHRKALLAQIVENKTGRSVQKDHEILPGFDGYSPPSERQINSTRDQRSLRVFRQLRRFRVKLNRFVFFPLLRGCGSRFGCLELLAEAADSALMFIKFAGEGFCGGFSFST
jgi:hypothetical protein